MTRCIFQALIKPSRFILIFRKTLPDYTAAHLNYISLHFKLKVILFWVKTYVMILCYNHTLRICNTHGFYMAKVVTPTRPNITLHVHGLSSFRSLHTFWYSICPFFFFSSSFTDRQVDSHTICSLARTGTLKLSSVKFWIEIELTWPFETEDCNNKCLPRV